MRWGYLLWTVAAAALFAVGGCDKVDDSNLKVFEYQKGLQDVSSDLAEQYVLCKHVGRFDPKSVIAIDAMTVCRIKKNNFELTSEATGYEDLTQYCGRMKYSVECMKIQIHSVTVDDIYATVDAVYPYEGVISMTYSTKQWNNSKLIGLPFVMFARKVQPSAQNNIRLKLQNFWNEVDKRNNHIDLMQCVRNIALVAETRYTVTFDVRYNAAKKCWLFDDSRLSSGYSWPKIPESINRQINESILPEGLQLQDGKIFAADSFEILEKYKAGLRLRDDVWLTSEQAVAYDKADAALARLHMPTHISVSTWEAILTDLAKINGNSCNVERFYKEVSNSVEKTVLKWRSSGNIEDLILLKNSIREKSSIWAPIKTSAERFCLDALAAMVRKEKTTVLAIRDRMNNLANSSGANSDTLLDEAGQLLKMISNEFTEDYKVTVLHDRILYIVYCKLLQVRNVELINDLYAINGVGELLREKEQLLLLECTQCRHTGKQSCIYCKELSGKCSGCKGKRFVNDEICKDCRGTGICASCGGKRKITCMSCRGLKYQISDEGVNDLLKQSIDVCMKIINDRLKELEDIEK